MVGNQGVARQGLQRESLAACQGMVGRHHHHMLPLVAGQGEQLIVLVQCLRGQADDGRLVDQHAGHLVGRALVQLHLHFRVAQPQLRHRLRQHIARLGVGGGDGQGARVLGAELGADAFEVVHLAHDDFHRLQHLFAGLGDTAQTLAVAGEDVHAQLFLQFQDGLADARLRGVQRLGGLGQVEVAPHRFLQELELVQVHGTGSSPAASRAMAWMTDGASPIAGFRRHCT